MTFLSVELLLIALVKIDDNVVILLISFANCPSVQLAVLAPE